MINLLATNEKMNMNNSFEKINQNLLLSKENIKPNLICNSTPLNIKLIEKDKIIFEFQKKEKENNNIIDELKNNLNEKNIDIMRLKQEKKELEYQLEKKEILLNKSDDNNIQQNKEINELILKYQNENENLKNEILNMKNILKLYEENKKENYEENDKNNKKIFELINQIKKNENLLQMFSLNEKNLKEENKIIPGLKRKINELNNTIEQYKNEIIELKKNNEKIKYDKEELNDIINIKTEEIQKEKINEQYVIRLKYKIDYLSKEIDTKKMENEILNNQNTILNNDIENMLNIFMKELNNYLIYLEGLNIYSKSLYKLPKLNSLNFDSVKISTQYQSKYDNLINVIHKIQEKIIDILNKNIEKNQDIFIDAMNQENIYKSLLNEKDELIKNKIELENKILCNNDEINKYKKELQIFKKDYYKIKNELSELNIKNKEITSKNKLNKQILNDFINDINNQLKNFPYISDKKEKNTKEEIINKINSLIILNKELNERLKNMEYELDKYKDKLDNSLKNNLSLKSELSNKKEEKIDLNEKIKNLKSQHEAELSNQKKIIYDKIYKLNALLEESNNIIKQYENEITLLKNKNIQLENNLKILSLSHCELEKIINNSRAGLKTELDIKEQKYNDILKELSIKNIHIKSLEKLLEQQNKNIPEKTNLEENNEIMNINFNKNNNEENFKINKYEEMKLNKLINGLEIKNKVNKYFEQENENKNNKISDK